MFWGFFLSLPATHLIHEHTWSRGRLVISLIGCNRVDPVHDAVVWVAMLAFVVCEKSPSLCPSCGPLPSAPVMVDSLLLLLRLLLLLLLLPPYPPPPSPPLLLLLPLLLLRRAARLRSGQPVSPVSSVNQLQPDPARARILTVAVNSLKRA